MIRQTLLNGAQPVDLKRKGSCALTPARFEIGNFSLPDIHGLAASLALIESIGVETICRHVLDLGDRLIAHLDDLGVRLVGPRTRGHRSHIYVPDLPAETWAGWLAEENVRVSPERDGIRVSFGVFNTVEDVDRFAAIVRRRKEGTAAP